MQFLSCTATFQVSCSLVWPVGTMQFSAGLDHVHQHTKFYWTAAVQADHPWPHEIPFSFGSEYTTNTETFRVTILQELYVVILGLGWWDLSLVEQFLSFVFGGTPSTLTKKSSKINWNWELSGQSDMLKKKPREQVALFRYFITLSTKLTYLLKHLYLYPLCE